MKIQVYLLVICIILEKVSGDSVEDEWKKFKADYGKEYEDSEEKHFFENFKINLQEIDYHNRLFEKGLVTYKKGITKFADLTGDEFVTKYMLVEGPLREYDYPINGTSNSTEYLSWKDKGAVTKVKDQGICGACWIYSTVGVLEGYYFRKNNKLITLSEQSIVDCFPVETCKGGLPVRAMLYVMDPSNGINTAEDYPNKALRDTCRYDKSKKVKLNITDYELQSLNQDEIKEVLKEYGPITIAIAANRHWRLYESGVWYEKYCSEHLNHAVLLVGYGTENGHDYWLIKNSYGKDWGLSGYIKLARNAGTNYCGIEGYVMYIK